MATGQLILEVSEYKLYIEHYDAFIVWSYQISNCNYF